MTPARRNVELKARDADPAATLERALALGASDEGVLAQRDTYFGARAGRLKLREQEGGPESARASSPMSAPTATRPATSNYRLADVDDPAALADALDAALGTLVVVDKRRRLLLYENVRIHIDDVERPRLVRRARGRRGRRLGPQPRARARRAPARGAGARRAGRRLVLRPAARQRRRAAGRRRRRHAQRLRPLLELQGRRRAALAVGGDPRRRQRRERRLPAGPVRRGVGHRGDGRRRRPRDHRRRRGGREARRLPAVRRLPPASEGVRRPRHAGVPRATRRRPLQTTTMAALLPLAFDEEALA